MLLKTDSWVTLVNVLDLFHFNKISNLNNPLVKTVICRNESFNPSPSSNCSNFFAWHWCFTVLRFRHALVSQTEIKIIWWWTWFNLFCLPWVNFNSILRAALSPISFCQWILNTKCKYRKAAQNTLVWKRLLVKCWWNWLLLFLSRRHRREEIFLFVC